MMPDIPEVLRRLPIDERRLRHDRIVKQLAKARKRKARRRVMLVRLAHLGRLW